MFSDWGAFKADFGHDSSTKASRWITKDAAKNRERELFGQVTSIHYSLGFKGATAPLQTGSP
jgi:hypothetical protein